MNFLELPDVTTPKNKKALNLQLDVWVYDQLVSKILSLTGSVNVSGTVVQLIQDYLGKEDAPYKSNNRIDSLDIDQLTLRARHELKKEIDYKVEAAFDRKALRESRRRKEVRRLMEVKIYRYHRSAKKQKGKSKIRRNKRVNKNK
jgi:hypothetical protein